MLPNFNFPLLQNLILAKYFNPSLHFFGFEKNLLKSSVFGKSEFCIMIYPGYQAYPDISRVK